MGVKVSFRVLCCVGGGGDGGGLGVGDLGCRVRVWGLGLGCLGLRI